MPKMKAPASGVTVRMYRQGHGDCFLLAMRDPDGGPFYMLIDCGLWTGSEVAPDRTIDRIIADIGEATGNHLNVVLITHEHMDHVNGFGAEDAQQQPHFDGIDIDETWLAWTEDATDSDANKLRKRFGDTLLALAGAALKLRFAVDSRAKSSYETVRDLLMFETGATDEASLHVALSELQSHAFAADGSKNMSNAVRKLKLAIKYIRDKAANGVRFFSPGDDHQPVGKDGPRIYALGPPRSEELLLSLDPHSGEGFHIDSSALGLMAATEPDPDPLRPKGRIFDKRFGLPRKELEKGDNDASLAQLVRSAYGKDRSVAEVRGFFIDRYGRKALGQPAAQTWRQIDDDWLNSAETLALRLNKEVNNTSLVIAIELPKTGKVLLFTGDAQRGNWISWGTLEWMVDGKKVKARDLLGRTVFYKVGHHGSHNATLSGEVTSDFANLAWLASGKYEDEFVAVIPANRVWAYGKEKPWPHPLKSIEEALLKKARGRVFRSDLDDVARPEDVSLAQWTKFKHKATDLYFEYTVSDK
ncbi:hypothetical protein GCM10010869_28850 [Mesorhizobium tianshanense]|uniref:Metallo-beta-lactamase domain-containing protein n=1 Tax=Mesorhizobium tianshanense TaxID=39844 RepID=A0A562NGR5_9HYPH|nr:hypothetical protein [Mesorhizobium tianshanense]TWI31101.1 hypothetical protein IQ26_04604 [Mesorhizobium tianshanense]GLS37292.1 hypothetical protein GCM10010869_28850 [Mesorhizobium tianshanense]